MRRGESRYQNREMRASRLPAARIPLLTPLYSEGAASTSLSVSGGFVEGAACSARGFGPDVPVGKLAKALFEDVGGSRTSERHSDVHRLHGGRAASPAAFAFLEGERLFDPQAIADAQLFAASRR